MRALTHIYRAQDAHWVGDGFAVQQLFSHMGDRDRGTNPFLMLDYAAPRNFSPNEAQPRGVGAHPHKGFETVTIAYQGEVAHRDSTGGGGVIGEGDVQWMTAGAGIIHEEFHSENFSKQGGMFEMVQLWVNLPAAHKNTPARYQHLAKADIPVVPLAEDAGTARIIAGDFAGTKGAAETFTPLNVWDIAVNAGREATIEVPANHTLSLVVLRGEIKVNGNDTAKAGDLLRFADGGGTVTLNAATAGKILLLSGEPINEPVVGYGPFVMNSEAEINQAIADFRAGKFGKIQ